MKEIILASESPRRKEILEKTGLKFKVVKSNFKEYLDPNLKPHELARQLSFEKAKAVFKKYKSCIIISADTLIVCKGKILGKPKNQDDAKKILRLLSGKVHYVITGFTIINESSKKTITKSTETKVYMRKISPSEITAYIKTGEPFGKAGGYAIQEKGSIFIKKIEGDYFNVVGLPIYALAQKLKKLGVEVL